MYHQEHGIYPHFAIGLEGGLEYIDTELISEDNDDDPDKKKIKNLKKNMFCMAWMAAYGKRDGLTVDCMASPQTSFYHGDRGPMFSVAKTANFLIPPKIQSLIETGMELGDADDQVFGRVKGKHGSGTVGVLTDGLINRSDYYEHALILALAPWIRPDINSK